MSNQRTTSPQAAPSAAVTGNTTTTTTYASSLLNNNTHGSNNSMQKPCSAGAGAATDEERPREFTRENPPSEAQLFKPSRTRNKGNFLCIRLIGPAPATALQRQGGQPPWTSDEAIGAWCTLCQCSIMWRKGESNGLSRHMKKSHQDLLKEAGVDSKDSVLKSSSGANKLPKRKADSHSINQNQAEATLQAHVVAGVGAGAKSQLHQLRPWKKQKLLRAEEPASNTKCSAENQALFDALTLVWIHNSLRPYAIVEDKGLHDLLSFASNIHGEPDLCSSSSSMRDRCKALSLRCDEEMFRKMHHLDKIDHFAISVDRFATLQTHDRAGATSGAFEAITVHYVTAEFESRSLSLSTHIIAQGAGDDTVPQTLEKWGLEESKVSMLLRGDGDTSSNLGAPVIDSIGKSLHMVVAPFCSVSRSSAGETVEASAHSAAPDSALDDIADFELDADAASSKDHVLAMQRVLARVRKIAKFVDGSELAKQTLRQCFDQPVLTPGVSKTGAATQGGPDLILDKCSRWTTSFLMIDKFVRSRSSLDLFFRYLDSVEGQALFAEQGNLPPRLESVDWALLTGFWILLTPFHTLTESLSMEEEATMMYAFPFLRRVKGILGLQSLFEKDEMGCASRAQSGKLFAESLETFLKDHEDQDYFATVVGTLEACQRTLREGFETRFQPLDKFFLWASMLDPRLRKLNHCTEEERNQSKESVIAEMLMLTKATETAGPEPVTHNDGDAKLPSSGSRMVNDMFGDVFDDPPPPQPTVKVEDGQASGHEDAAAARVESKATDSVVLTTQLQSAQNELTRYLLAPSVDKNVSALRWWRENATQYPMLSRVARKWLSVVATGCLPSDRVFSNCGLVQQQRLGQLPVPASQSHNHNDAAVWRDLEAQLQLKHKLFGLQLSVNEIADMTQPQGEKC